jgi:benzoyl-CoA reductase subunit BamB
MTPWGCAQVVLIPLKPRIISTIAKFISAGAGFDMDEAKLTLAAKRYRTLVRAVNIRRACGERMTSRRRIIEEKIPELEKGSWIRTTN